MLAPFSGASLVYWVHYNWYIITTFLSNIFHVPLEIDHSNFLFLLISQGIGERGNQAFSYPEKLRIIHLFFFENDELAEIWTIHLPYSDHVINVMTILPKIEVAWIIRDLIPPFLSKSLPFFLNISTQKERKRPDLNPRPLSW